MRATGFLLGVVALALVALALVASPLAGAEETKAATSAAKEKAATGKPAAEKQSSAGALKGEYAMMVRELKLTEAEQAKLKEKVDAKDAALATWDKANADKVKAAQDAAKKAKESTDKEAMKKTSEELKAITAERTKIQSDGMAAIYGAMTAEQRQTWEGFTLFRSMSARFRKADLTTEQDAKIRPLCDQAAKEILAVKGDEKTAQKTKSEIQAKLRKQIEDTILTADQKAAMTRAAAPKAAAEKEPKAAEKPATKG